MVDSVAVPQKKRGPEKSPAQQDTLRPPVIQSALPVDADIHIKVILSVNVILLLAFPSVNTQRLFCLDKVSTMGIQQSAQLHHPAKHGEDQHQGTGAESTKGVPPTT